MEKENQKRRKQIFSYIEEKQKVMVSELADHFCVTKETIRLDLDYLEKKGVVTRIHGGVLLKENPREIPLEYRIREQSDEKRKIASVAIQYVKNDQTIYMDASSSVLLLAHLLRSKKNLTIYTNSIQLANIANHNGHKVFLIAGIYYAEGQRTTGGQAAESIQNEYFDACFMSCDGLCGKNGVATGYLEEVVLLRRAVEHSTKKILLADCTKLSKKASHQFAKTSDFDVLITTKPEKTEIIEDLDFRNIKIAI